MNGWFVLALCMIIPCIVCLCACSSAYEEHKEKIANILFVALCVFFIIGVICVVCRYVFPNALNAELNAVKQVAVMPDKEHITVVVKDILANMPVEEKYKLLTYSMKD